MKKILLLSAIILFSIRLFSQITIQQTDMPEVDDTFRVSLSTTILQDPELPGEDYFWDYSDLIPVSQRVDTFVSVYSTPLVYNAVFSLPLFDPIANLASPLANPPDAIPEVQITERYDFYKNSSASFTKAGKEAPKKSFLDSEHLKSGL